MIGIENDIHICRDDINGIKLGPRHQLGSTCSRNYVLKLNCCKIRRSFGNSLGDFDRDTVCL